jgi:hypothetical protein
MKRAKIVMATLVAASALGGTAHAAIPPAPGVAFLTANRLNGQDWYVGYSGPVLALGTLSPAGPVTGNHLTVAVPVDGHTVTFDEPTTLMLPDPVTTAVLTAVRVGAPCPAGLGHVTCTVPAPQRFCTLLIYGGTGPDAITVRYLHPEYGCVPQVFSGRGLDRIDSRDGHGTRVSCGLGYDRVEADVFDDVRRDCEVVNRS